MKRNRLVVLPAALLALLAGWNSSAAAEGRFGLSDPTQVLRFEAELNDILLVPPAPGRRTDQSETETAADPDLSRILGSDPGLAAAWRVDPRATLALIDRIRKAGGQLK